MLENKPQPYDEKGDQSISEPSPDENEKNTEYVQEVQKLSGIETFFIAGIVAICVGALYYLYPINILQITTFTQLLWVMFSLLIAPSALFLLIIHLYTLYRSMKTGKKTVLLSLDLFYFLYILIAGATILSLYSIYQRYVISIKFLSSGWFLAVVLLFFEVGIVFYLTRWLVMRTATVKFPDFIPIERKKKSVKKQMYPRPKPAKQVYYFHEKKHSFKIKQNNTLWQDDPSYIPPAKTKK